MRASSSSDILLANKNAVIYEAGGAVGSAVSRAFAKEGARVFVTGRNLTRIETLAKEIVAAGGVAEGARVDALEEQEVETHLSTVAKNAGTIDISFNAIGIPQQGIQGIPLTELSVDSFTLPIRTYMRSHFLTAKAGARRMIQQRSGVILMHTPEPARLGATLVGGPTWAAMEGFCRFLSAESGPHGVRVLCLRTTGLPETGTIDVVFDLHAKPMGITRVEFQSIIEGLSHRRCSTTLQELVNVATFLASDRAAAMTGTVANLTGGIIVD